MRHLICALCACILLSCCAFDAFAADVKVDGDIQIRTEYQNTSYVLQDIHRESNCSLTDAYLHWRADPENNSLYIAVQYASDDMDLSLDSTEVSAQGTETQSVHAELATGIEITVNGKYCGVIRADSGTFEDFNDFHSIYLADGYSPDLNRDRCALEAKWRFFSGSTPHAQCEMRLGLKYWEGEDLHLGIRIFDYSGASSNYHTVLVYEAPTTQPTTTTTTPTTETTRRERTTHEPTTKPPTTTRETTRSTTRKETTMKKPPATARHARLILTSVPALLQTESETTTEHTTREKTTKPSRVQARTSKSTTGSVRSVIARAEDTSQKSARTTKSRLETTYPIPDRQTGVFSTGKTFGIILASSLVTGAVMFSAFAMGRSSAERKHRKEDDEAEDRFE